MKTKLLKTLFLLFCLVFSLGLSSWLIIKSVATHMAEVKAQEIITAAYQDEKTETPDEKITLIAAEIFNNFEQIDPALTPLYKLRPYLTNRRLPDFLKLQDGVMETFLEKGFCDNAARFLTFTLKQAGFTSKQWDMVTPQAGHVATIVSLPDGRSAYIDPLYGVVAKNKLDQLISPSEAFNLIKSGKDIKEVFSPLNKKANYVFYNDFTQVSMAAEDMPLIIKATLPKTKNVLTLGTIDNDSHDVQSMLSKYNTFTVFNYVGHRYNRNWVRVLKASNSVRVTFILTKDVENGVITSEPKPKTEGNKMMWDLKAGEEIRFYDGRAKISWRRLNSYIDVDQIVLSINE